MNVFQRYLGNGDPTYYGRFRFRGKQVLRDLGTHVKKDAEKRLRDIYAGFEAGRFDAIEQTKLRPDTATLGAVLSAFATYAGPRLAKKTRDGYRNSLRYIVRTVLGASPAPDDRSTSELTQDLVLKFQNALLTAAGADRTKQERAKTTANSILRQARAVFAREARATYTALQLPAALDGFMAAPQLDEPTHSYHVPTPELMATTLEFCNNLRHTDRNCYIAFLLSYAAGMRRNEIAHARYNWLAETTVPAPDPTQPAIKRHTIRIGVTDDFRPKGRDARTVPIEAFVWSELQALRIAPMNSETPDYIMTGGNNERTEETFERLGALMRGLGWKTDKYAHELRKFYGSRVATVHGLFAAQKLLGHKKPDVTSRYYAGITDLPDVQIFAPAKAA